MQGSFIRLWNRCLGYVPYLKLSIFQVASGTISALAENCHNLKFLCTGDISGTCVGDEG
jgi:hypothetical protein